MITGSISNPKLRIISKITVFLTILCMLTIFIKPAYAGLGTLFGYTGDDMPSVMIEICSGTSAAATLDNCFNSTVIEKVNNLSIIDTVTDFTKIIGLSLVLIHVVICIIDAASQGLITQEHLLKLMLAFALPVLFILNYGALSGKLQEFGIFIKDELYGYSKTDSASMGDVMAKDYEEFVQDYQNPFPEDPDAEEMVQGAKDHPGSLNATALHTMVIVNHNLGIEGEDSWWGHFGGYIKDYWENVGDNLNDAADNFLDNPLGSTWTFLKTGIWDTTVGALWNLVSSLFKSTADEIRELIGGAVNAVLEIILIIVDIIIRVGIMVCCYGCLGRLVLYQCFLPMGIADIGKEGTRSNGMRMIKSYFAVFLEMGMLFIINLLGWYIFKVLMLRQDSVGGLVVCFIAAGTGIKALMKQAGSLSRNLLGVR